MKDLEETIKSHSRNLEQRKDWYSPVANAYDQARPRYPENLIHQVVELAQLPSDAILLEVGCGPGTATVAFAHLGFSMICLEPSQAFCRLARQNCKQYPSVKIQNTSFEEWELEPERFNAVLAATSIHWVPPDVAYPKAAEALQNHGSLILLWNMMPEPRYEAYQVLQEVYETHAPSLARYEGRATQAEKLQGFGQNVIASGRFTNLVSEQFVCEPTYSIDDYLMLLSTLSLYLELDPPRRNALFKGLRERIEQDLGGRIQLSYLSAFQIAQKC